MLRFYALKAAVITALFVSQGGLMQAEPAYEAADLQFLGDLYISSRVIRNTKSSVSQPKLFSGVRELLSTAHANIVNFEGTSSNAFVPYEMKYFLLNMPLEVPAILSKVNIGYATLANNHSMDYGYQSLFDSIYELEEAGLQVTGAGIDQREALRPLIFAAGGRGVCVVSSSKALPESFWAKKHRPGTASVSFTHTAKLVRRCKQSGFYTAVVVHWGAELMPRPKSYQRKLARLVIDNGADVVIGHHPHILQSVEIYKNRLVMYSIGNFAFGTLTKGRIQEGASVRVIMPKSPQNRTIYDIVPLNVNNDEVKFVPRPLVAGEVDPLIKHMPQDKRCRYISPKRHWRCVL